MKEKTLFIGIIFLFTLNIFSVNTSVVVNNLVFASNLKQQEGVPFSAEKVVLKVNKQIFLTGETIYYSLFVINKNTNKLTNFSKIAYVYLIDSNKKVIFKHKLRLKDGTASGDYFLLTALNTGNYKLIGITNNRYNKDDFTTEIVDLVIINPFSNYKNKVANKDTIFVKSQNTTKISRKGAVIFHPRSKVNYTFTDLGLDQRGNFSVSVEKIDSIQILNLEKNPVVKNSLTKNIIPELRGELISGKLVDLNNNPISKEVISLSISNNPNLFKNVETNASGDFFFNLYEDYSSGKIVLNTLNKKLKDSSKIILHKKELLFKDKLVFKNVLLDKSIAPWLKERNIQNQIENIYYDNKKDSILPRDTIPKIIGNNFIKYHLDDYKRFETIKETFVEIVLKAYVRNKNNKEYFQVRLPEELFSFSKRLPPLVLIDGFPILDHNILFNYDPYQIENINVLNNVYFYGPKVYAGVIDVETVKRNYFPDVRQINFKEEFTAPLAAKIYFQPDYSNTNDLRQIPDFRTHVYFNPKVNLKDKGISFYTSDVKGVYQITILGYTNEGKYIEKKKLFQVK